MSHEGGSMATDLRDRLHDLADRTPSGSPPPDLWTRGVRRRRVVRAGRIAIAAAVVVLVALGGWTWHTARPVQPADPQGTAHLPDRFFYDVSAWTHTFDRAPGPLVTVFPAVTRRCDTPRPGSSVSPRRQGTTASSTCPATRSSRAAPPWRWLPMVERWRSGSRARPAAGRTPRSTMVRPSPGWRSTTPSPATSARAGSRPSTGWSRRALLIWTDDQTLAVGYGQILAGDGSQNSTTSHSDGVAIWDLAGPRPITLKAGTLPVFADNFSTRTTDGTVVTPGQQRRTWVTFDSGEPGSTRTFRTSRSSDLLVLSPDHLRVIGVLGHNGDTGSLAVARVPANSGPQAVARFHRLPLGDRWFRPLAWVDDDHVAVLRRMVVRDPEARAARQRSYRAGGPADRRPSRTLVDEFGANGTNESDPWVRERPLRRPVRARRSSAESAEPPALGRGARDRPSSWFCWSV